MIKLPPGASGTRANVSGKIDSSVLSGSPHVQVGKAAVKHGQDLSPRKKAPPLRPLRQLIVLLHLQVA